MKQVLFALAMAAVCAAPASGAIIIGNPPGVSGILIDSYGVSSVEGHLMEIRLQSCGGGHWMEPVDQTVELTDGLLIHDIPELTWCSITLQFSDDIFINGVASGLNELVLTSSPASNSAWVEATLEDDEVLECSL